MGNGRRGGLFLLGPPTAAGEHALAHARVEAAGRPLGSPVTVVVRAGRLPGRRRGLHRRRPAPGGGRGRAQGQHAVRGDPEREQRRAELLRRAAAALRAVERFRSGQEKELAGGGALALAIGKELAADGQAAAVPSAGTNRAIGSAS
jgi:hypothetical protein